MTAAAPGLGWPAAPPASQTPGLVADLAEEWQREMPGLDLHPFLVTAAVLRLAQRIDRVFAAKTRMRGLGPGDMRVLLALRRSRPPRQLSPTALFRHLMITSGAVSKQVDRLAELGLVERIADPDVLRGVLIRLTPAGLRMAEDMAVEVSTSFAGLETLPAVEAEQIIAALDRVAAALDGEAAA
jgi:DNA-binding MarR family transcriptional regulator